MNNRFVVWTSAAAGLVLIGVASYYWMTPANDLASYMPGYDAGSSVIHFKHGLGAFILAALAFVFSWFQSA